MKENDDVWSLWLKQRRFTSNRESQKRALEQYKFLASKIINKAQIFESAIVLDIGAGDGIVGFAALEHLGPNGKLIFSDISESALSIPKEVLGQMKEPDSRIEFLVAGIENLHELKQNSIDRIVFRAVLLYVKNNTRAFNEIFRVLKKGGIAVILEPINQRHIEFRKQLFRGYRLDRKPLLSVYPLLKKVMEETNNQVIKFQNTIIGYDEHSLAHIAIETGFQEVRMEYDLNHSSGRFASWDFFFNTAPNSLAKTLNEIMKSVLTPNEFEKVVKALKKSFEGPTIRTICEALFILKK